MDGTAGGVLAYIRHDKSLVLLNITDKTETVVIDRHVWVGGRSGTTVLSQVRLFQMSMGGVGFSVRGDLEMVLVRQGEQLHSLSTAPHFTYFLCRVGDGNTTLTPVPVVAQFGNTQAQGSRHCCRGF